MCIYIHETRTAFALLYPHLLHVLYTVQFTRMENPVKPTDWKRNYIDFSSWLNMPPPPPAPGYTCQSLKDLSHQILDLRFFSFIKQLLLVLLKVPLEWFEKENFSDSKLSKHITNRTRRSRLQKKHEVKNYVRQKFTILNVQSMAF